MDGWRSLATVVMQFVFSRNAHDFLQVHGMTAYIGMFIQKRCLPSLATLNMMNLMEPNGSRRKHPIALGQRRLQLAVCPVHYLAWPGRVHQGWDEEPEARDDPSTRRDQASAIGTIGHRHHEFHFQCDLAIKKQWRSIKNIAMLVVLTCQVLDSHYIMCSSRHAGPFPLFTTCSA